MAKAGSSGLNVGDTLYYDISGENFSCTSSFCGSNGKNKGCQGFFTFVDGKLTHRLNTAATAGRFGWHNRITAWDGNMMYACDAHSLATIDASHTMYCFNYGAANTSNRGVYEVLSATVSETAMVTGLFTSLEELKAAVIAGEKYFEVDYLCAEADSVVTFINVYAQTDRDAEKPYYVPEVGEIVCLPFGHGQSPVGEANNKFVRPRTATAVLMESDETVVLAFHTADTPAEENSYVRPGFYQVTREAFGTVITLTWVSEKVQVTNENLETLAGYEYLGGPEIQRLSTFEGVRTLIAEGKTVYVSQCTIDGITYICGHSCTELTTQSN